MPSPAVHNHPINHIAISVPNLDAAVEWYSTLFGFKKIRSSMLVDYDATPHAPSSKIYGDELKKVKIALMGTGNGVGFEIFEFIEPRCREPDTKDFEYTRADVFHICVTVADVEDAVKRVVEMGGRQLGETMDFGEDHHGEIRRATYVRDPWGTVVELLSCGFEALNANT